MPAKRILLASSLPGPMAGGPGGTGTDPWYREKPVSLSHRASGVRRIPKRDHCARHLDKAQRVIQDVMDHLHRFSPDAAVPNQWEGWTYGITLHLKDGQTCMLTLHPAAQAEGTALRWTSMAPAIFPGRPPFPDLAGGILLQRHGPSR